MRSVPSERDRPVTTPFKSLPTIEQLATKVLSIHTELRNLANGVGNRIAEHEQDVRDNTALTDEAIEELTLKIAFLMAHIQVRRQLNGGLAGPDGRVPVETKSAIMVYNEMRPQLIERREELRRAQGLSTESVPQADGDDGQGAAEDPDLHPDVRPINGVGVYVDDEDDVDTETRH